MYIIADRSVFLVDESNNAIVIDTRSPYFWSSTSKKDIKEKKKLLALCKENKTYIPSVNAIFIVDKIHFKVTKVYCCGVEGTDYIEISLQDDRHLAIQMDLPELSYELPEFFTNRLDSINIHGLIDFLECTEPGVIVKIYRTSC